MVIGGKGWLAVRAAELVETLIASGLVDARIEVVRTLDDDGRDSWMPSLVAVGKSKGWPVLDAIETAGLTADDRFLSLQYDRIVDCTALAGVPAYNLHFAYLPRYRGSLTSALPLRNGESTVGVTLHELVQEVDAGPIIAQSAFPVPPFLTAFDLYRAYHDHGFELLKAHLPALIAGRVTAVPQDHANATAFTRRSVDFSDVRLVDFDRDAATVRDHCRSLVFPPAQYPTFHGRPVASAYVIEWPDASGPQAGTELVADARRAVVACKTDLVCFEFADPATAEESRSNGA